MSQLIDPTCVVIGAMADRQARTQEDLLTAARLEFVKRRLAQCAIAPTTFRRLPDGPRTMVFLTDRHLLVLTGRARADSAYSVDGARKFHIDPDAVVCAHESGAEWHGHMVECFTSLYSGIPAADFEERANQMARAA